MRISYDARPSASPRRTHVVVNTGATQALRDEVAARLAVLRPTRRDFLDEELWQELARLLRVKLPPVTKPLTVAYAEGFLKATGKSLTWYRTTFGETIPGEFALANPDWPARAWAGLVLELAAKERGLLSNGFA